jgi:dephospho-CoA kinase
VKSVGVTGGIGSGKSTVARILGELGARVVDADKVGHHVYRPGSEGWEQVVQAFGREIVAADGSIDRRRLGAVVFAASDQLARLNAIVHPLIRAEITAHLEELQRLDSSTPVVVEAAVLIEAGWQDLVDEVWLVVASRDAVLDRVAAQRGLTRSAIEARIAAQLSDAERRRHAAVIIDNSGTLPELQQRLRALYEKRLAAA